jgi:hypothetical protein
VCADETSVKVKLNRACGEKRGASTRVDAPLFSSFEQEAIVNTSCIFFAPGFFIYIVCIYIVSIKPGGGRNLEVVKLEQKGGERASCRI